jgi:plasmid stability protein
MATLTIRSIPDEIVERIREVAKARGSSMEQEVRELLQERYADRRAVLDRIRERWATQPSASVGEVGEWVNEARRR